MRIRRSLPGMHKVFYHTMALALITGLTLVVNFALFLAIALQYHNEAPQYVKVGEVLENLTTMGTGYALSESMQVQLTEMNQWAMLLDENGHVIWSYKKPEELKESYSRSEIARMSKWYLKDYPVYLRVWNDRILVVGLPKYTMWKYNIECPEGKIFQKNTCIFRKHRVY